MDQKVIKAWETVAKYLSNLPHNTTFFIDHKLNHTVKTGNDYAYTITSFNKKTGELDTVLESGYVTTLEKIADKHNLECEVSDI